MSQFGIHTFQTHLDLIRKDLDAFRIWNGGADPAFAGRNFLGGDYIWAPGGATNAICATKPSKNESGDRFTKYRRNSKVEEGLQRLTSRIAPMQAPQPKRQKLTGDKGIITGKIDAQAICRKVHAGLITGEFFWPKSGYIYIWLAVEDDNIVSAEYWAGWADEVNRYTFGDSTLPRFRACIYCRYNSYPIPGFLQRNPALNGILIQAKQLGFNAKVWNFWADASDPKGVLSNLNPNWEKRFLLEQMPGLWYISDGLKDSNDEPSKRPFGIDIVRPPYPIEGRHEYDYQWEVWPATEYMLLTSTWLPKRTTTENIGFLIQKKVSEPEIIKCIQKHPIPEVLDQGTWGKRNNEPPPPKLKRRDGKDNYASTVGRYLKRGKESEGIFSEEADKLSETSTNSPLQIFSCWERGRKQVSEKEFNDYVKKWRESKPGEDLEDDMYRAAYTWERDDQTLRTKDRKDKTSIFGGEIEYFRLKNAYGAKIGESDFENLRQEHGYLDGLEAFKHAAEELKQPPQTPIYFGVDVRPSSSSQLYRSGQWKQWVKIYFEGVKLAREDYLEKNPDYFYLIGVYGTGEEMRWCYENGIVSYFWQAVATSFRENGPPNFPWYHANRWQFYGETGQGWMGIGKDHDWWKCAFLDKTYKTTDPYSNKEVTMRKHNYSKLGGADPDADWGDGGTWNLEYSHAKGLEDSSSYKVELMKKFNNTAEPR